MSTEAMLSKIIVGVAPVKEQLIIAFTKRDEAECYSLFKELQALVVFKKKYDGRHATKKGIEPNELLTKFWQRHSDACPLEAAKAESEENEFNDWALDQYEEMKFEIEND